MVHESKPFGYTAVPSMNDSLLVKTRSKMLPCDEIFDEALGRVTSKFVCVRKKSSRISQKVSVRKSAVVREQIDQSP